MTLTVESVRADDLGVERCKFFDYACRCREGVRTVRKINAQMRTLTMDRGVVRLNVDDLVVVVRATEYLDVGLHVPKLGRKEDLDLLDVGPEVERLDRAVSLDVHGPLAREGRHRERRRSVVVSVDLLHGGVDGKLLPLRVVYRERRGQPIGELDDRVHWACNRRKNIE